MNPYLNADVAFKIKFIKSQFYVNNILYSCTGINAFNLYLRNTRL